MLIGLIFAIPGAAIGWEHPPPSLANDFGTMLGGAFFGVFIGYAVGVGVGAAIFGWKARIPGRWWTALLGSLLGQGCLIGLLYVPAVMYIPMPGSGAWLGAFFFLPLLLAVFGYGLFPSRKTS